METNDMQASMAASIASAGTAEYKPFEPAKATDAPSTEGNQQEKEQGSAAETPAAPTDGQPTDESKVENQESKAEPDKSVSSDEKSSKPIDKEEKAEEAKEPDEEALIREALGLKPVEAETPEVLRSKYEASSKEAHRLVEEAKAKALALAEAGVEFTRGADGKFYLKANQKYMDDLKDVPDVYGKLSEEDQGLVTKEVAAKIVKAAMAEALPKRPVVTAKSDDNVLSDNDVEKAFDDLASQKLGNGQPRFADIKEDSTQKFMRELYDRPESESFRKWMNQSPENFKEGLSMLHASVFRVRAPLLAARKDAEAAKKSKEEELKKKPATVASGTGVKPDAMRHRGTPSGSVDPAAMAKAIASAQHR